MTARSGPPPELVERRAGGSTGDGGFFAGRGSIGGPRRAAGMADERRCGAVSYTHLRAHETL
ncbi:hypothetical protein, partial [Pseudomonas aeruginosa]|uniref:hypothetical protein n=1 Tax=Pseudomonas aeruginosa TaxID=287 RepID=UPI001CA5EE62